MKTVQVSKMTLLNFKGTRELTIDFGKRTQIKGNNRTGKTTVADAFNWVLFGKNSKGETDFDIKTLDENNEPIHKLSHEVEITLTDGTTLKKVYKEVWRKKHGEAVEYLDTHSTDHYINDVPKKPAEYSAKVATLINADIARLICDAKYFNEILKWEQRRVILANIAQTPTVEEIASNSDNELATVVSLINQGKNINDEKKRVQAKKKLLKDEQETIDPKIAENTRMKPEPLDYVSIEKSIEEKNVELLKVEDEINDVSKAYQSQADANAALIKSKAKKQSEYSQLDSELRSAPNEKLDAYYKELNAKRDELKFVESNRDSKADENDKIEKKISVLESGLSQLRNEHTTITASNFVMGATSCPTCSREYDNANQKQEDLRAKFNDDKAEKLKANKEKGLSKKAEKEGLESELKTIQEQIETLTKQVISKQAEIDALVKPSIEHEPTAEMIALQAEINAIVIPEITKVDTTELTEEKKTVQAEIDALKDQLSNRDRAKQIDARIEELTEQKRKLSQEIADLEKLEFAIESYQNAEMDLIEKRVNEKFALVKFKMFEKQMNGGVKQTCVCMVNGVPYRSVNTAGQIQASLDIINTIQHHYQTFAPVFIDNAESITEIPVMQCQTVELYVVEGLKNLEIYNLD